MADLVQIKKKIKKFWQAYEFEIVISIMCLLAIIGSLKGLFK